MRLLRLSNRTHQGVVIDDEAVVVVVVEAEKVRHASTVRERRECEISHEIFSIDED